MPPPLTVQTNYNKLVTDVATAQSSYTGAFTYWQGARTTGDATAKPSNPAVSWADVGVVPPLDQTVQADYYSGPQGEGYVVVSEWTDPITGAVWRKVTNTGPETWRAHDWQRIR